MAGRNLAIRAEDTAVMGIVYQARSNPIVSVAPRLLIRGRVKRDGRARISGAKNSAVALLPACLLADGASVLQNVPDIAGVAGRREILHALGASVVPSRDGERRVRTAGPIGQEVPSPPAARLRGSVPLRRPLVARLGRAR